MSQFADERIHPAEQFSSFTLIRPRVIHGRHKRSINTTLEEVCDPSQFFFVYFPNFEHLRIFKSRRITQTAKLLRKAIFFRLGTSLILTTKIDTQRVGVPKQYYRNNLWVLELFGRI